MDELARLAVTLDFGLDELVFGCRGAEHAESLELLARNLAGLADPATTRVLSKVLEALALGLRALDNVGKKVSP